MNRRAHGRTIAPVWHPPCGPVDVDGLIAGTIRGQTSSHLRRRRLLEDDRRVAAV